MNRNVRALCSLVLGAGLMLSAACSGGPTLVRGSMIYGPGIVVIERGNLYEGTYEKGGLIAADGSFEVELPTGGIWGVHLYAEDQAFYMPIEKNVLEGRVNVINQMDIDWDRFGWWTNNPEDPNILPFIPDDDMTDNPSIANASAVEVSPGTVMVSVDATDPNDDLSQQILVVGIGTDQGLQLNPPSAPIGGDYPNGTYTATVFLPEGADLSAGWMFVAADHGCSASAIIEVPLE